MNPVARRYAKALYEEAQAGGVLDTIDDDVQAIRQALDGSRELALFFESPIVAPEKKAAVIEQLFAGKAHDLTMRFLRLLIEKGRENLVPSIARAYGEARDEQRGIVEAHVKSAAPMGADEMESLKARLERQTGKTVRLRTQIDDSLLGGIVVRIGDVVYDGSVRQQLATLRSSLRERAAYSLN